MLGRVKDEWSRSSKALTGTDAFWERSAAGICLLRALKRLIPQHARGKLLDAGAGTLSIRHVAKAHCTEYQSLDAHKTHPELDHVGDIQRMPLPEGQFDTVLCLQVLEHVSNPEQALREIHRVLAPGGKLIISVPHLDYLHNEPDDYFRYTKYGLDTLLKRVGFRVHSMESVGGFASFVQRLFATLGVGLTYETLLWPLFFAVNRVFGSVAVWLDARVDKKKLLALYFVAVAEKA
ncbi:MAG: type 11 methyltransferase [Parcubacteria group bacterium Gr01-1014_106]|nr:MAG: type 11 methyltransferase [Parcubacteria group bacterium Gr01-1014_106]